MKSYLILGASSAIARYFISRLKDEGNIVNTLSSNKGEKQWIYETSSIRDQIIECKPEIIINFVGTFTNDYLEGYKVNVLVSKSLFDAAIEGNFNGKIILVGSAAEYGIQSKYIESCKERPLNIYGFTKLIQHNLFQYYIDTSCIRANYIRPFGIIDTHLSDRLFIGNFTKQIKLALKGEIKEIVLGDLNSYRDFLLIDDVYTGFMDIIANKNIGETYNLGMGETIFLREFVQRVLSELKLQSKIIVKTINPVGGIKNKVIANTTKIRSIGWAPKFNFELIIKEYCKRIREEIF